MEKNLVSTERVIYLHMWYVVFLGLNDVFNLEAGADAELYANCNYENDCQVMLLQQLTY